MSKYQLHNDAEVRLSTAGHFGKEIKRRARAFERDESGVLVAFGVFLILMLLAVGGIGMDLMRFEYTRTSLQSTLDRAVLAAADLDQTLDSTAVVQDYFSKSEMATHLKSVTVDQGLSHKQVSATAEIEMQTQLIHMLGIETLNARAAGTARESIGAVEISLVLDVSGSMGSNSRLANMKVAAKDFVDLVISNSAPGDVSISLVPYATQVSMTANMFGEYNSTEDHVFSHCIDFIANEFNNTQILPTDPLQQTAHFDPWNSNALPSGQSLVSPVCPTNPNSRILPLSNDATVLKNRIDLLTANGNTSIDLGVKWGAAMLDPTSQPIISALVSKGEVDSVFADRPMVYDSTNNLKIIVVMTDGENTEQPYMLSPYTNTMSDIWMHNSGKFSVKHNSSYYYPHNDTWNVEPYKDINGQGSQQLSYPDLHSLHPLKYLAGYLWGDILGSYNAAITSKSESKYEVHNSGWKDQRLDNVCGAAKNQGVVIFTIAFEAPNSGQRVMEKCASSDGHYFDADGLELSDAFVAIASSISKLRLTQ